MIFVLSILAGMFKAMRDTIAHHWYKAIFRFYSDFWREWFKSDWKRKEGWPFINLYIMFFDGWHFSDQMSYICMALCMFYFKDMVDFFICLFCFSASFNLFYHVLFVEKG